jgi:hypothetical protein
LTKKKDPFNKKYTPELVKQLLTYIEAGNYIQTACNAVGVTTTTYRDWLKRYPDFAESVHTAEAIAIARNVTIIQVAAKTSWQASAWWLERKFYNEWGRKTQVGGIDDNPIAIKSLGKEYEQKSNEDLIKEFEHELTKYQTIAQGPAGIIAEAPGDKEV